MDNQRVFVSRDVTFFEDTFPFKNSDKQTNEETPILLMIDSITDEDYNTAERILLKLDTREELQDENMDQNEETQLPRCSTRTRRPPRSLDDFIVNNCHTDIHPEVHKQHEKAIT